MITFDGDRSKKKAWLAEKQIKLCKMLGVTSKTVRWDGFTCKGWTQGDLTGGFVLSPMGAVVAYSNFLGIQLCIADSWTGAFTSKSYQYGLTKEVSSGYSVGVLNSPSDLEDLGYSTFQNAPVPFQSPYNLSPVGLVNMSTYYNLDDMPTPWVSPILSAEAFWLAYSSSPQLDPLRDFFEISRMFYSSNGSGLTGRVSGLYEQQIDTLNTHGSKALYPLPSTGIQVVEVQPQKWPRYNGNKVHAFYFHGDINEMTLDIWYLSTIIKNLPLSLQGVVLTSYSSLGSSVGNYVFSTEIDGPPTILTAIDLTNQLSAGGDIKNWFDDNPGNDHWQLSYHFNTWGDSTVYTQHSGTFMSVLVDMAAVHSPARTSPSTNYVDAAWVMYQLFARPNHNFSVPYDNSMWNDEDGNVYSWSRLYGSYKWTKTSLSATSLTFNSIIESTDGVKPTVSFTGEEDLYLCVGEYLGKPTRIKCIDIGSPITGVWTELPIPVDTDTETVDLVHLRPIEVTSNKVLLLGIIEKIETGEEGKYYLAFLQFEGGLGTWVEMAQVPATRSTEVFSGVSTSDYSNWSVALFGQGKMAQLIGQYLTQPTVMTQMPIPEDYSGYETGMP